MATYKVLRSTRIPFARGHVEQRIYDRLSVDMIVQHRTRAFIGALQAGRAPSLGAIKRSLRIPLTQRRIRSDT